MGANPGEMANEKSRKTLFLMVTEKATSWPLTLRKTIISKRREQKLKSINSS